jgi:hypothetical protein
MIDVLLEVDKSHCDVGANLPCRHSSGDAIAKIAFFQEKNAVFPMKMLFIPLEEEPSMKVPQS